MLAGWERWAAADRIIGKFGHEGLLGLRRRCHRGAPLGGLRDPGGPDLRATSKEPASSRKPHRLLSRAGLPPGTLPYDGVSGLSSKIMTGGDGMAVTVERWTHMGSFVAE